MLKTNIINSVNIEELPESVREAILVEFNLLNVQEKLVIYSRLIHGNLFKADRVELFKINKISVAQVYEKFIDKLKIRLGV